MNGASIIRGGTVNDRRLTSPLLTALAAIALGCPLVSLAAADESPSAKPNILWISSEDHGPHLGCYGDTFAKTPNVDRLATRGCRYTHVWSCAPVCAPARTTIISGLYPPTTGGDAMRSMVPYPADKAMFPQLLRAAGYFCTNNSKEDYNLTQPGKVWDESSGKAHWRSRREGQPFFAVFNSTKSHESQIRTRRKNLVHDPAGVRVPAYHPDTPEVRQDWAQYYDQVSLVDADAGELLAALEKDGLADNTIVWYWADHGSGMPRNKRWPYDSGLHVPLVAYIPPKFRSLAPPDYRAGGTSDRMVSFVDFAPTVLSLAGVKPPDWMQGRAFLGEHIASPPEFAFGFRGRMDERIDLVRSMTDGRYVYIHNYLPHRIYGQHVAYMFITPTTRVWQQLFLDGKLNDAQSAFWKPKPPEEFYDLQSDRDEVHNLAGSVDAAALLQRFRQAMHDHLLATRDLGFLPEGEMHARSQGTTPYDLGRSDRVPLARILATAELASSLDAQSLPRLREALADSDSAVRFWAAQGILMRGAAGLQSSHSELTAALTDRSNYVRIVAAEALAQYGDSADVAAALPVLVELANWKQHDAWTALSALNSLDLLEEKAKPVAAEILKLPREGPAPDGRYKEYVPRVLEHLAARFGAADDDSAPCKKRGKK